ncbi:MAG: hypothetical protein WA954_06250 [Parerythrobacter sp.]
MRRSLVVTDDAARHPFLASLPPHVRSGNGAVLTRAPVRRVLHLSHDDWRGFWLAYAGCFLAVSIFIF